MYDETEARAARRLQKALGAAVHGGLTNSDWFDFGAMGYGVTVYPHNDPKADGPHAGLITVSCGEYRATGHWKDVELALEHEDEVASVLYAVGQSIQSSKLADELADEDEFLDEFTEANSDDESE